MLAGHGYVEFEKDETIFKEGDPCGDLWIIKEGSVEVYVERDGRKLHLSTVNAGEMLGTMTATTSLPRQASCRAITPVRAVIIRREKIDELFSKVPKWVNGFIKDLVARVQQANKQVIYYERYSVGTLEISLSECLKISKAMIELAPAFAVESGGLKLVPIDRLMKKLFELKKDSHIVRTLVTMFLANELLREVKLGEAEDMYIPLSDFQRLEVFNEYAAMCVEIQNRPTDVDNRPLRVANGSFLIVDDEPELLDVLALAFQEARLDHQKAYGAKQAIKLLVDGYRPEVVITDLNMPGMDGFKFADWVRSFDPQIKIIFCSGYATRDNIIDFLNLGAYGFLQKPVSNDELIAKAKEALEARAVENYRKAS